MLKNILLTGGTGTLGLRLIPELQQREDVRLTLFTRETDQEAAQQRLQALGIEHTGDLDIRSGSLDSPEDIVGVASAQKQAPFHSVIHSAALTKFDQKSENDVNRVNLEGTRLLLEIFKESVTNFFYISTAYVAGDFPDVMSEENLMVGQNFNNPYERSKAKAELLVREAFQAGVLTGSIMRPSIVMGATSDGSCEFLKNIYSFLRIADFLKTGDLASGLRLFLNPETRLNLIPVDWTARTIVALICDVGPTQKTYHVTNPQGVPIGFLYKTILEAAGLDESAVSMVQDPGELKTKQDKLVRRQLRVFADYVNEHARFSRQNLDEALPEAGFPDLDQDYFEKIYQFACQHNWKDIEDR